MEPVSPDLASVLEAFGLPAAGARSVRAPAGLIQLTLLVDLASGERWVVQRMHPIFGATVLDDLAAVSQELRARGLHSPRLRRTSRGELGHRDAAGQLWRVLEYIPGRTVDRAPDPEWVFQAARAAGEFHAALSDWPWEFRHVRAGVHDTGAHLARLREATSAAAEGDGREWQGGEAGRDEARRLAETILTAAAALPTWGDVPLRVCHGDLKLSNVLFEVDAPKAVCLIDLDTCCRQTLAYEIGDAWRSWCNLGGEDQTEATIDAPTFEAAVSGYAQVMGGALTAPEVASLVPGFQTVALELAARFCVDVFRDEYFGWDASRFPSRRAHNLVRARGQLAVSMGVRRQRSVLESRVQFFLRGGST